MYATFAEFIEQTDCDAVDAGVVWSALSDIDLVPPEAVPWMSRTGGIRDAVRLGQVQEAIRGLRQSKKGLAVSGNQPQLHGLTDWERELIIEAASNAVAALVEDRNAQEEEK